MAIRLIKTVFFTFVVAFLTSCNTEIRCNVLHIGDSLMSQSSQQIVTMELIQEKAVLPIMNAIPGSGLQNNNYWIPRIGFIKERIEVEAVFISLGTNDAGMESENFPSLQELDQQIHGLLSAIGSETIVYWILPHKTIREKCAVTNQFDIVKYAILRAYFSGDWPNLSLLSFDHWVEYQNEQMDIMLEDDGIHFTTEGKKQFAQMIQYFIDKSFPI